MSWCAHANWAVGINDVNSGNEDAQGHARQRIRPPSSMCWADAGWVAVCPRFEDPHDPVSDPQSLLRVTLEQLLVTGVSSLFSLNQHFLSTYGVQGRVPPSSLPLPCSLHVNALFLEDRLGIDVCVPPLLTSFSVCGQGHSTSSTEPQRRAGRSLAPAIRASPKVPGRHGSCQLGGGQPRACWLRGL